MTVGGTAAVLSSMCDVSIGSEEPVTGRFAEYCQMLLIRIPASVLVLSCGLFLRRDKCMREKTVSMYDDRIGIVLLMSIIMCVLLVMTFMAYYWGCELSFKANQSRIKRFKSPLMKALIHFP
jgi:hypothetical protein